MQKKSKKVINEHLRKILAEIKVQKTKADKKGLKFSSLTEEQLRKKLKSLNTPLIYGLSWRFIGTVSTNFTLNIFIYNPDPIDYDEGVTAYAFFGPANTISDVGLALISADPELNRMFAEFGSMPSGAAASVSFNFRFPAGTPLGLHLLNGFVFVRHEFDKGYYIDRACVDMTITP